MKSVICPAYLCLNSSIGPPATRLPRNEVYRGRLLRSAKVWVVQLRRSYPEVTRCSVLMYECYILYNMLTRLTDLPSDCLFIFIPCTRHTLTIVCYSGILVKEGICKVKVNDLNRKEWVFFNQASISLKIDWLHLPSVQASRNLRRAGSRPFDMLLIQSSGMFLI